MDCFQIAALGYKSVAHYLIQTKRAPTDDTTPSQASAKRSLSFQEKIAGDEDVPMLENDDSLQKEEGENTNEDQNGDLPEEVQKVQNMECQSGGSLKKEEDETPNSARRSLSFLLPSVEDDQTSLVDVQVLSCLVPPKQEHSCAHNGDDLPDIQERIGQHSNLETKPDSYLLHVDEQIPLVDVQVLSYLETPKQEHSCAHIGDGLPKIQEWIGQDPTSETKPVSYLIPIDDDQTSLVDAQVMYLETPKQDKQEHSCAHIGDDLPEIQQGTGQDSNLETRLGESQTLVVKARVTRSKRKAALEPNPDSIGGRLRQRRRT